jgi:CO/xanthine dehydrogenase FAD-binding subunit
MAALVGTPASTEQFKKATEVALGSVSLRASKFRATHEYRAEMIRTYLPVILDRAAKRAATGHAVPEGVAL